MAAIVSVRCGVCFLPRKKFGCTAKRCLGPKPASPATMKMRAHRIQRENELEDRIRQDLKATAGKSFDLAKWQALETASRSNGRHGRIIRLQALEWLRLESLYRSFSVRTLAAYEMNPELSPREYRTIKARDHDQLLTTHPVRFWPYSLTEFAAGLADEAVKVLAPLRLTVDGKRTDSKSLGVTAWLPQFDWIYFTPARVLLSFDAHQKGKPLLKDILRVAKQQIKNARTQEQRQRRLGAGRRITLDRLAEALWAYDLRRWDGAKNIVIGAGAQSFGKRPPSGRQHENRAAQLLRLATRMIAQRGSETWFRNFRC